MFAHGGYTKVQHILGKAVNERIYQKFRANKELDVINWIDAGSSAELPGAPIFAMRSQLGYYRPP